jgi:hypothetical protein
VKSAGVEQSWVPSYNHDMTIEHLRAMHQARPFQPFDIHLADGRTLPVDHPEFLSSSVPGRTIAVANKDVDAHEIVDLLLVVSLKPRAKRAARPGKRKGESNN